MCNTFRTSFLALALLASQVYGQLTFQRTIGGSGRDFGTVLILTADNGYAMAGTTSSFGAGNDDLYLIKLDANGDTLWTRTYGGANNEYGSSVIQTIDGGYLIMGSTESFGATDKDIYAVKTNASGGMEWSNRYGNFGNDYGVTVRQTTDGGYLFAGSTYAGAGVVDAYVIRTDENGAILWSKTYGGSLEDDGNALLTTADGGFILAGITRSFGAGGTDMFVLKTDTDGAVLWQKTYGGEEDDYAFGIEHVADGGYIITGSTTSGGAGGFDACLVRIDASGTVQWAKTYGSSANDIAIISRTTNDDGYVVLGQSFGFGVESDVYLVKTDGTGNVSWSRNYGGGGYEFESDIRQTPDGGYLISAGEESFGPDRNVYLIKTDTQGDSGCDQGEPMTVSSVLNLITGTPASVIGSGGTATITPTITSHGGAENTRCSSVGVQERNTFSLSAFPVPFADQFTVSGTASNGTLVITDLAGKWCSTHRSNEGSTSVDARNLQSGSYVLRYVHCEHIVHITLVKE